tara:strand:- start:609 stop:2276 length:1668 start_codon:yes stop_codon:yes gene_type:complete
MANYKIPSLLPNITAAKISVPNNAYTNPQPIIDKSFEVFNKGMQQAVKDGLTSSRLNEQYRAKEKEAQKKLSADAAKQREDMYSSVTGLADTGNNTFDKNKQNYFYSLKDKYIKIKNMMDENPDLQQEGAKQLAMINGEIEQFKKAAPEMLKTIVGLKDALKIPPGQPGAVSSEVPDDIQRMLLAIVEGGPEVTMVNKDGNLMLYMPPQTYEQNGETIETNGAQFDINSFLNLSASGGDFIKTIPDFKEEFKDAANAVIKTANGKDNPLYYTLSEVSVGDNKDAVVKEWNSEIVDPATNKPMVGGEFLDVMGQQIPNPFKGQKINGEMLAQIDMIRTGAFNSLINPEDSNDNDMSILWADVMPDELTKNAAWNPANKNQLGAALNWLSQQSVNEFGIEEGVLTHQNKPKSKGDGSSSESQSAMDIYNDLAGLNKSNVSSYFKNKKINGKDVLLDGVKLVDKVNDYGEIVAKDALLTIEVASGKTDDDGNRTANPRPYDLTNPVEFETLINDVVGYEHSIKGGAKAKAIRDSIKKSISEMTKQTGERNQKYNTKIN